MRRPGSPARPARRTEPSSTRWLLAPTWLLLGTFLALPLLALAVASFARRGTYGGIAPIPDLWAHVTTGRFLGNYLRSVEPLYLAIGWRSLWLASVTTALCLLVAFPCAYYLARLAPPRRRPLLLALVVLPFWTSFLVRTYAWLLLLRDEGIVNRLLGSAGLADAPLPLLYTPGAVLAGLVYGELPYMILPLWAVLERLDGDLLAAAADLGASRRETFLRVTLPLAMPGVIAGTVLVFVPSLGQFVVSDLLGGARTMLLGNLVQNQVAVARNLPFAAALAVELAAFVLALLWAAERLRRRTDSTAPGPLAPKAAA